MSTHDEIARLENALRRLVEDVLRLAHGDQWMEQLGVTEERIEKWKQRREEASKHATGAVVEARLLDYSDFPDLLTTLRRNWELFKPCFGDKKETEVYLERLNELRNPDAHSRPVLPHEESLAQGISRELRQKVTIFRNSGLGGPEPEHFCRIEEVSDSFNHRVVGRASGGESADSRTNVTLRPGDVVAFRASAVDPHGRPIRWLVRSPFRARDELTLAAVESPSVEVEWDVTVDDIHDQTEIIFTASTVVGPHRFGSYDDDARLIYRVLPAL